MTGSISEFRDKHVVMSGGGSPIGRALARRFLGLGARVSTIHRSAETELKAREAIGSSDALQTYVADLRSPEAIASVAAKILVRATPDILIHAAGAWHDETHAYYGPTLAETPTNELEETLAVGVLGAMRLTRSFLEPMRTAKSGKILFFTCGFAGPHEAAGWVPFYTNNQALESLCRGVAAESRIYNIQANCLSLWYVDTPYVRRYFPEQSRTALPIEVVVEESLLVVSSASSSKSGQVTELRSPTDVGGRH